MAEHITHLLTPTVNAQPIHTAWSVSSCPRDPYRSPGPIPYSVHTAHDTTVNYKACIRGQWKQQHHTEFSHLTIQMHTFSNGDGTRIVIQQYKVRYVRS
jgi:hypothetical protein